MVTAAHARHFERRKATVFLIATTTTHPSTRTPFWTDCILARGIDCTNRSTTSPETKSHVPATSASWMRSPRRRMVSRWALCASTRLP